CWSWYFEGAYIFPLCRRVTILQQQQQQQLKMVTPTGDEQYYQLPEVQEEEFEQVWFQAENPFAQFDKVGKKRRNLEINEIQEEINSAKIRKLNEEIENYKIQLSNNSQQMGIVIEQNDRLQEDNEKLIDENSELGKK